MIPSILVQIIFIPALVALLIFLFRYQLGKNAGWLAVIGLAYTTGLLLVALTSVSQGDPIKVDYQILINPDIRFSLLADGLSIAVALICNILCLVLCIYSIKYVDHRIELIYEGATYKEEVSYYSCFFYLFLFFPLGFMGVSFAADLVVLYFFLEVLTIILYFLMAYFGYYERVRVATMCLIWGIFSAVLFLAGVLIIYSQIGTFQIDQLHQMSGNPLAFWAILIILIGMFAKLAIIPLHVWMPWVHAEHPTCIAGLLAVYANIAAYVIVRTLVLPLYDDMQVFGPPIMILAVATMIYGSLLTLAQTDMKRIPACSTISQSAYSMLGIGALTAAGIEGGLFFFLSHIMGKTVFFSTCGLVVYMTHIRNINHLSGLAYKMPITAVLFMCGGMMLAGIPPFSSLPAEVIMFTGIFERADAVGITTGILGLMAILLTVGYAFYFTMRIFFGKLPENLKNDDHIKDPPWLMTIPLIGVVLLAAFLGLYPSFILDLFDPVITQVLANR
ncbi:NADH/Ubiquinone/plastoquinone (complex I) [Desulfonatronospira thiodismutans ASO3-1]|uniref:NADH/Ubiquinone/plastoquinone (Complex I) n=1 Tax=Desulfonatronospira thiodismutans ASO3-1 TaxID=555779 RepID=D6SQI7_9BACT|nr:NADH-quinone oxidoreductase subunit M [Desulfonatronospira thiodismutans]EFI35013.1 NADH/Ubiquinone/plastoquinone (complex I) [Desulfonatronospira thiodismutans ASO3-1]